MYLLIIIIFCSTVSPTKEGNQQREPLFSGDKFSDLDLSTFMVINDHV